MGANSRVAVLASAAGLLASAVIAGPAASQTVEFRGDVTFSGFSAGCAAVDIEPGSKFKMRARFRPPSVGDNDGSTRIAFFVDYYGASYKLDKGTLGSQFKPVFAGATGSTTFYFEAKTFMRFTKLAPSSISATTKKVSIGGEIKGFEDAAGCIAKFAGTLQKY